MRQNMRLYYTPLRTLHAEDMLPLFPSEIGLVFFDVHYSTVAVNYSFSSGILEVVLWQDHLILSMGGGGTMYTVQMSFVGICTYIPEAVRRRLPMCRKKQRCQIYALIL